MNMSFKIKWSGVLLVIWSGAWLLLFLLAPGHLIPLGKLIFCGWMAALACAIAGMRSETRSRLFFGVGWGVSIGCFLLLLIMPRVVRYDHSATRSVAAQTQIASFTTALDNYEIDTGSYPAGTNGLEALLKAPTGVMNWQGPYLTVKFIPPDPWGQPYIYRCRGVHNPNSFDLSSRGPTENGGGDMQLDSDKQMT